MKKGLIWLGNLTLYLLGLSGVLVIILLFNQASGEMTWFKQIIGSLILLMVGMGMVSFFNRQYQAEQTDLFTQNWQLRPTLWAIFYGFLLLLATQIDEQIRRWLGLPESLPDNQLVLLKLMQEAPLLLMVFAGILAPIAEELLFRGLLFRWLGKWIRQPALLILISACVFALPHQLPNDWYFVIYAVMGAIMALCYWHTKSLKYAILSHFINNAITLIIMWQY